MSELALSIDQFAELYINPAIEQLGTDLYRTLGRRRSRFLFRRYRDGKITLEAIWAEYYAMRRKQANGQGGPQ